MQGGKYRILSVLGQGGFGITYAAEQVALGRKVALKEFFMEEYCNRDGDTSRVSVPSVGSRETVDRFRSKFVKEAKMIAGLNNPHVVRIHDVFEENGTAYYVMEYHDKGSLKDEVAKHGALPEIDAVKRIREVADALRYLHDQSILHLDVKPGNVLVGDNGEMVLIDFGVSKCYDEDGEQTSSTPVAKSKGYAPSELYISGSVSHFSPATDIYSLGATFYHMVTGMVPPDASAVSEEDIDLSRFTGLSEPTRHAIEAAMQPRRKDRPQSIAEFLKILDGDPNAEADNDGTDLEDDSTLFSTRLDVTSTPSGAAVTLDGKPLGATPIRDHEVTAGLHELRIEKSGYEPYISRITFGAEPVGIIATLNRKPSPAPKPSWRRWAVPVVACLLMAAGLFFFLRPELDQATGSHTGTHNGHEWVDLGLSVRWATCNVGASRPSGYGNCYAWGEVRTKSEYEPSNCTTWEISMGDIAGDPAHDAARYNWGGWWRLPTEAEWQELLDNCTWTWTKQGGHKGYMVTSRKNGASIFLPAAGCCFGSLRQNPGNLGFYLSSTPYENDAQSACHLRFLGDFLNVDWYYRHGGHSVRPVLE